MRGLTPDRARVWVAGDSEFGAVEVMKQLEEWGWYYVLRQKSNHLVREDEDRRRRGVGSTGRVDRTSGTNPLDGERLLEPLARLPDEPGVALEERSEGGAVAVLATNLVSPREALSAYKKRMWIEELFADLKGHGFDLWKARGCVGSASFRG